MMQKRKSPQFVLTKALHTCLITNFKKGYVTQQQCKRCAENQNILGSATEKKQVFHLGKKKPKKQSLQSPQSVGGISVDTPPSPGKKQPAL